MKQSAWHINISHDEIKTIMELPITERNQRCYELFKGIVELEACKHKRSYLRLDVHDLQGNGYVGLFKALDKYQQGKGDFVSFIWHYISGYMTNHCNKELKNHNRMVVSPEITGTPIEECNVHNRKSMMFEEGKYHRTLVRLPTEASLDESMIKTHELEDEIKRMNRMMRKLLIKRDIEIMKLIYVDDVSTEEVGKRYGLTVEEIYGLCREIKAKVSFGMIKEYKKCMK